LHFQSWFFFVIDAPICRLKVDLLKVVWIAIHMKDFRPSMLLVALAQGENVCKMLGFFINIGY